MDVGSLSLETFLGQHNLQGLLSPLQQGKWTLQSLAEYRKGAERADQMSAVGLPGGHLFSPWQALGEFKQP